METRPLLDSTLTLLEVDLSDAQQLDDIVYAGYLEGLRDAAWRGDPRQMRLGLAVELALGGLATLPDAVEILHDEDTREAFEQAMGVPVEKYADFWADSGVRKPLAWEQEARALIGELR